MITMPTARVAAQLSTDPYLSEILARIAEVERQRPWTWAGVTARVLANLDDEAVLAQFGPYQAVLLTILGHKPWARPTEWTNA